MTPPLHQLKEFNIRDELWTGLYTILFFYYRDWWVQIEAFNRLHSSIFRGVQIPLPPKCRDLKMLIALLQVSLVSSIA